MNEQTKKDEEINPEMALIGCLISNGVHPDHENDLLTSFLQKGLHAGMFQDAVLREIMKAIYAQYLDGKPIDTVTLAKNLAQNQIVMNAGGNKYIASIFNYQGWGYAHADYYFDIVKDNHRKRCIIAIFDKAKHDIMSAQNAVEQDIVIGLMEKRLFPFYETSESQKSFSETVDSVGAKALKELKAGKVGLEGLATGIAPLDNVMQGLRNSEVIIVAARPSVGKTAFMMQIVRNVAQQGDGVLVFSLEMSREALVRRMLFGEADYNRTRLMETPPTGLTRYTPEQIATQTKKVNEAIATLRKLPIEIIDYAGADVQRMRMLARWKKRQKNLKLIAIDYTQLIASDADMRGRASENEKLTVISAGIKAIAKELNVPVIALSQLNRLVTSDNATESGFEKPKLSHLRGSGALEQDADVVLLLNRKDITKKNNAAYKDRMSEDDRLICLNVAKNRNGATCDDLELAFNGARATFSPLRPIDNGTNLPDAPST